MSAPKGGQLVCGEALKAVVACTKSALTLRPLPFPFLPVCVASSCASPEVQARALFFAQRRSAALQGASWWSKKAFEGVPAELRQLFDALLRGADHGSGHTGQRHGCRRDRVVAYGQRQCVHRVLLRARIGVAGGSRARLLPARVSTFWTPEGAKCKHT